MIKKYDENEFVVNGIEIREIEYFKDWNDDDTWFKYEIERLEAYINNEQIDIEDDSIITEKLLDLIVDNLNEQLNQEEYLHYQKLNI